jgi:hypothetical protein
VRRLLGRGAGKRPVVTATLLEHADDGHSSSLEFSNEGGPAENVVCVAEVGGRVQQIVVGTLAPGEAASVHVATAGSGAFRCVWSCFDLHGRQHVWSYDGRHERRGRRRRVSVDDAFRELYPGFSARV